MLMRVPGNNLARGVSSPADRAMRSVPRRLTASPSLSMIQTVALFEPGIKTLFSSNSREVSCRRRGSDICDWRSS
jgi:hypothetical protein